MRNINFIRARTEAGSSLAESMVALGLVVMGLLGIVVLYTRSFALNRDVVDQTIAAGLAAEGIEVVKNIIDAQVADKMGWPVVNGWFEVQYDSASLISLPSGKTESIRPLRFDSGGGIYSYGPSGVATSFTRTVAMAPLGGASNGYRVNAVIEWWVHGVKKTLNVEDHFFNWRP